MKYPHIVQLRALIPGLFSSDPVSCIRKLFSNQNLQSFQASKWQRTYPTPQQILLKVCIRGKIYPFASHEFVHIPFNDVIHFTWCDQPADIQEEQHALFCFLKTDFSFSSSDMCLYSTDFIQLAIILSLNAKKSAAIWIRKAKIHNACNREDALS